MRGEIENMREREAGLINAKERALRDVAELKATYMRGVKASVDSIKKSKERYMMGTSSASELSGMSLSPN